MRAFFSDNPLYTRQDAIRAAADLIRPLVSCMTPEKGRVMIGSGSAHYSEDVAGMEGFSHALWALVPMLLGKCPEAKEFWPLWQEGIRRGTDPEDPEYWGDICRADQRMVEMAVIGIGLCFAREYFYDSLLPMEQDRLIAWLNQINLYDMPKNNWRFFRILVNIGFRKVGRAADEKRLKEDLDLIESHYAGDGWYFDYPARRDYYTLWGFHFYSLLYAAVMRGEDPDRCARFEERAKRIAPRLACWFDREGRGLPYGRSLTYRFAQSSFWSAMAFAGITAEPLGWGEIKGLVLRNLRFWLSMPIFDRGGALTVGYGYPNLCVAEGYNAPGSPYWALKTFFMFERCLQTIKGRSTHLENRTAPTRTDGRNLLTGVIFCKSCGCRLCYQHNVLRRKLADGTPRVYERHQFRCYRKISSRHSCKGPSSYEAEPIIAAVESEIRSFLARIHCTPEEKLISVVCSRNAEMYEIAYKQAVQDYEKSQKQVSALEDEAVKALTGESQLDLKVVNAMLLKHREKLEAAQLEMEQTRNRMEQEEQNRKATKAQVDELRTWGEIYAGAKDEVRHMIIARLVDRIDVEAGNKITIKYRVSFEQFMSAEQASA